MSNIEWLIRELGPLPEGAIPVGISGTAPMLWDLSDDKNGNLLINPPETAVHLMYNILFSSPYQSFDAILLTEKSLTKLALASNDKDNVLSVLSIHDRTSNEKIIELSVMVEGRRTGRGGNKPVILFIENIDTLLEQNDFDTLNHLTFLLDAGRGNNVRVIAGTESDAFDFGGKFIPSSYAFNVVLNTGDNGSVFGTTNAGRYIEFELV